ncbi:hypothetical protein [Paraburkholderia caffeinilytica]|uniref:hypothetical protein n=1 Tax=Paraburkholderia caffeinilytica TaxID=1761016 RepID=UPI0038B8C8C2
MSKIVQAANVMISRKNLITDVTSGDKEIFFTYNGKYHWSIAKRDDDTLLWFYPRAESLEELVGRSHHQEWEDVEMVTYRSSEIGTREASETFDELYTTIKEKLFGVDEVLDDIINDDPF